MWLPDFLLNAMLAWAAWRENRGDHDRALRGYRRAAKADHNVNVRVRATDGVHRVQRELTRRVLTELAGDRYLQTGKTYRARAQAEEDLFRAHIDTAKALLARADRSRSRLDYAAAKRDLQAAIDKCAPGMSGQAALEFARMIDFARGYRTPISPRRTTNVSSASSAIWSRGCAPLR